MKEQDGEKGEIVRVGVELFQRQKEDLFQSATRKELGPQEFNQSRSGAFNSPNGTRSTHQIVQEDIFQLAATNHVVRFFARGVFAWSVFNRFGPAEAIQMESLWKVAEFPPMTSYLSHIAWTPRHWVTNKNVTWTRAHRWCLKKCLISGTLVLQLLEVSACRERFRSTQSVLSACCEHFLLHVFWIIR